MAQISVANALVLNGVIPNLYLVGSLLLGARVCKQGIDNNVFFLFVIYHANEIKFTQVLYCSPHCSFMNDGFFCEFHQIVMYQHLAIRNVNKRGKYCK